MPPIRHIESFRYLGVVPVARWVEGSIVIFHSFGLTRNAARVRALRKAKRLGRVK